MSDKLRKIREQVRLDIDRVDRYGPYQNEHVTRDELLASLRDLLGRIDAVLGHDAEGVRE